MKPKLHDNIANRRFSNPLKIFFLISGIVLLGFSSCITRRPSKYGPPPTSYQQQTVKKL